MALSAIFFQLNTLLSILPMEMGMVFHVYEVHIDHKDLFIREMVDDEPLQEIQDIQELFMGYIL